MPSVAAIVIGDEILSGKFADENGPFLIRRLRELGADLERLVVISDGVERIADEVRRCAAACDLVITTGGVGPTHDDRTLEGVARGFGVGLVRHPELVALMEGYGMELNEAALRMATVPDGTELVRSDASSFPVLKVRNVYVFPGVPKLLQRKFEVVAPDFTGTRVGTGRLYTDQRETEIAADLAAVQEDHPGVGIGSYPRWGDPRFKVIMTFESRDSERLRSAIEQVRSRVRCVDLDPEP